MSTLLTNTEDYWSTYKYKVTIKTPDESDELYIFDSFQSSNPFVLTGLDVNLGIGQNGDFQLKVDDTKDKVLKNTIDCGAVVKIEGGKTSSLYRSIMYGIIDDIDDSYSGKESIKYVYKGIGMGVILNYTYLNFIKSAQKDGIESPNFIVTDPNFRVDNLTLEAFQSTEVLPMLNSKTLEQRGGFNLTQIAASAKEILPSINSPLGTASSLMEMFAGGSGSIFWIDPEKNVLLRHPMKKHSGITIRPWQKDRTDSAYKTSYYLGGWQSNKRMKTEAGFYNRIFLVINTETVQQTSPGSQTPIYTSLAGKDVCFQFIPGNARPTNIAFLMSKTGTGRSQVDDSYGLTGVQGIICKDDGNFPSDKVVAKFNIPYDEIPLDTPAAVYKIDLDFLGSLDPSAPHWFVIFKRGELEESTVRLYHDNDYVTPTTATVRRYSGTKMPFTRQPNPDQEDFPSGFSTSANGPSYKWSIFENTNMTLAFSDPISIRKYTPGRPIEARINAPWIRDVRTGTKIGNSLIAYSGKLKRIFSKKMVSIPQNGFMPLEMVTIVAPQAGIEELKPYQAEINTIAFHADAYEAQKPFGSEELAVTAIGYIDPLEDLETPCLNC